ncbi:MAG: hypothetical protein WBA10_08320 [Elainellaceae cyanobacterium]
MKPMIWHPEPRDKDVNAYLDHTNREPWVAIIAASIALISAFTALVLVGVF